MIAPDALCYCPPRSEADLQTPFGKYLCLGLGLLFLGKQDVVEATLEVRSWSRARNLGGRGQTHES